MNKYKIGYTTGVFDLFHIGHLNILKSAKALCEYLIVGVTTDELVSYKNKQAVIPFEERLEIVSKIVYVDKVVPQYSMNKVEAWEKYKFDVMFVGSDWKGTKKWIDYEKEFAILGVDIVYFPYTKQTSSTILKESLDVLLNSSRGGRNLAASFTPSLSTKLMIENQFIEKFKLNILSVSTIGNWIISLRPQQLTIGSMVITLNRKCNSLSEITDQEGKDLGHVFYEVERLLKHSFLPEKVNYLALMMIDNQVHFHVIPRYSKIVEFNNRIFSDIDWPGPPTLSAIELNDEDFEYILNKIRNAAI